MQAGSGIFVRKPPQSDCTAGGPQTLQVPHWTQCQSDGLRVLVGFSSGNHTAGRLWANFHGMAKGEDQGGKRSRSPSPEEQLADLRWVRAPVGWSREDYMISHVCQIILSSSSISPHSCFHHLLFSCLEWREDKWQRLNPYPLLNLDSLLTRSL